MSLVHSFIVVGHLVLGNGKESVMQFVRVEGEPWLEDIVRTVGPIRGPVLSEEGLRTHGPVEGLLASILIQLHRPYSRWDTSACWPIDLGDAWAVTGLWVVWRERMLELGAVVL